MENIFNKLTKENKELYLCGDFNIDLLKIDDINSHKKFYELLCSYGLLPQIFYPTRECGESLTIIDNIFTNNLSSTILSGNIHTDISDHYSQFVFVKRDKIDYKTMSIYSRDYSKFCVDIFRDDVSIQNFNVEFDDVNHQFNDLYFKLAGCVERHAPIKKLSTKEVKLRHKPWISNELIKMIKIRNKLHRRKKRQSNNENIKRLYNLFRNRIIREMKKSKRDHYNKYFEKHCNDVKKTWNGIRSIINIKNSVQSSLTQLNVKETIITNPKKIVEEVNNYFANVGPETEKLIPLNPISNPTNYLANRNRFNFLIAHVSNEEVLEIILKLENKATGPQSIPIHLLKLIPDLILVPLCRIISLSFSTGIFPDALKICKTIPIHKGGLTTDIGNYRPISLLSVFDKIIEKLMHKRLYNFLEEHNILFCNQFGFRKNNLTSLALIQITEKIKESIDNKQYGCGIFIDLRKAFDTVNHSILLTKLEHYGIRGTAF